MEFRTKAVLPDYPFSIDHHRRGLVVGSCFATEMAARLVSVKMPVAANPAGVVYNPLSVAGVLRAAEAGRQYAADDLVENDGLWCSLDHHGSFSGPDRDAVLKNINRQMDAAREAFRKSDYLILTWGTAWAFRYRPTGAVAANCQKIPAAQFERFRIEPEAIVAEYDALFSQPAYQSKNILLTVSPIRHLRDGMPANQLSKSILIVAAHRLAEKFPNVHYFPAYEILMDDLRDYRFYEADMVHPTEVAVSYIWELFCEKLVTPPARELFKKIEKVNAALGHRPFRADSDAFRTFRQLVLTQIEALEKAEPTIDWSYEKKLLTAP